MAEYWRSRGCWLVGGTLTESERCERLERGGMAGGGPRLLAARIGAFVAGGLLPGAGGAAVRGRAGIVGGAFPLAVVVSVVVVVVLEAVGCG